MQQLLRFFLAPAQVLLAWAIQQGICVIPKSNSPQRLIENLGCGEVALTEGEMQVIDDMNINERVSINTSFFA